MKKSICALIATLVLSVQSYSQTQYNYPYQNPDIASLTPVIMKSMYEDAFKRLKGIETTVIPGREKTFFFEKRSKLRTNFYPQKKDAPLTILIADITGSPVSGYMMYMADLLQANGHNVITMPSPLFWGFVVSSSSTGLPGLTSEDAADMYRAMQLVLSDVKNEHNHNFTKTSVVGFGFGGLLVAHIADLDKKEQKINANQFVLINPVVNLMHAVTEIETRTAIALELGMAHVEWIKNKAFNFVYDTMDNKKRVSDPDFFMSLESKFPLSNQEYKFLTGAILRLNISDTIFSSQLVNDLGILKSKISRLKVNARHKEIEPYGLVGYVKSFFFPYFSKKYRPLEILKQANLNLVRETLVENKNIFLIHNADDFLINREQLTYLEDIFESDRRIIYPQGGHLGNLWFEANKQDLLRVLAQ